MTCKEKYRDAVQDHDNKTKVLRRFEKISFEKTAIQYEKKIHVQPSLNKNVATPL